MTIMVDRPNVAYLRDVHLELHPSDDFVSETIRQTGDFYEAEILDEIRRRFTGGVIVDVGAMIGNHSAFLAAFVPHTAIHAFEPAPVNLDLLHRNVAEYPTITVHPVALSDHAGTLAMAVDPTNRGHAMTADTAVWPRWYGKPFAVPARTLDSYGFDDVSLIKVDVEGHEPRVLGGARDTIARCRPLIVIEDWTGKGYADLTGYRVVAEWERAHQTFMYEAIA